MTVPTESGAGPAPDLQQLEDLVRKRFAVSYVFPGKEGFVEFYLDPVQSNIKAGFLSLLHDLQATGYTAVLRRTDQGYQLTTFRKQRTQAKSSKLPTILFFATILAVFADGIIRSLGSSVPIPNEILFAGIYTAALMGILGIHELGHKIASWHHGMESSWPYFIPGIPGIWPTFGAVISARDPPPNRDSLFDLGLSGPMAGLAVTVLVSIVAVFAAQGVPLGSVPASQLGSTDFYTTALLGFFRPALNNEIVTGQLFYLLYLAYSFGFLITFINLLPAWQLDGGHISNAAVSPKVHKILTFVSIAIMFLTGFYLMGILILLFYGRAPAMAPLDNVSPLSTKRKVFFILTWIVAALIGILVLYNNAFFGPSLGLIFKL